MSNFKIDATIGTNEVVDALVHNAIVAMRAEHVKQQSDMRQAESEADRVREEIDELLVANPPVEVKALVESTLVTGLFNIFFSWAERTGQNYYSEGHLPRTWKARDGLCRLTLNIESFSNQAQKGKIQGCGQVHINLTTTEQPPNCIPEELMEQLDAAIQQYNVAKTRVYQLACRLEHEQQLRTELRGEMLNRVLSQQAPEIAAVFGGLVADELKAITVIETEE